LAEDANHAICLLYGPRFVGTNAAIVRFSLSTSCHIPRPLASACDFKLGRYRVTVQVK
jgi:hypothetical protein